MTFSTASSTYQTCDVAGVPDRVGVIVAQAVLAGAVKEFVTCVKVVALTDTVAEDVDRRVLLALYQRTDIEKFEVTALVNHTHPDTCTSAPGLAAIFSDST